MPDDGVVREVSPTNNAFFYCREETTGLATSTASYRAISGVAEIEWAVCVSSECHRRGADLGSVTQGTVGEGAG